MITRTFTLVVGAVVVVVLGLGSAAGAGGLRQSDEADTVRLHLVSQNLWVAPNGRLTPPRAMPLRIAPIACSRIPKWTSCPP